MINVVIQRSWSDNRATLGMLSILNVEHNPIFTLENPLRATTVDSRIPAGEYNCAPYNGTKYKDVYIVNNVPGRTAILFHHGNFERNTEGCILLGLGCGMLQGSPAVTESKPAMFLFRQLIGKNEFKLSVFDRYN